MKRKKTYDYYDNEEAEPFFDNLRTEQEVKPWDVFKDPPRKNISSSMEENSTLETSLVILKILTSIATFFVILGGAVVSKGTLLFMTSQIKKNQSRVYCNEKIDKSAQFVVTLTDVERVAWIWMIIFAICAPEIETFLRSFRILIFKTWKMPSKTDFFVIFVTESLPTIGTAIFVFAILPQLDVVRGAMLTNAVCIVPAVIGLLTSGRKKTKKIFFFLLDIASIVGQISALIIWPLISSNKNLWLIPIALLLVSCGWWENYVSEECPVPFVQNFAKTKKEFPNDRYFVYIFASLWKCVLFFATVCLIIYLEEGKLMFIFENFLDAFSEHHVDIFEVEPIIGDSSSVTGAISTGDGTKVLTDYLTPVWVFLINLLSTYLAYITGKFACKVMIQTSCYALPVNITVPVLVSLLIAFCGLEYVDVCFFQNSIPSYLSFNGPSIYFLKNFIENEFAWIWLLWLLSQTWITVHIWTPRNEKLAKTEKLFRKPMYDSVFIDQSLALNRKKNNNSTNVEEKQWEDSDNEDSVNNSQYADTIDSSQYSQPTRDDETTRVYACATMWHETTEEMMEFLKSVLRLDEDQCAKRLVKNFLEYEIPDYYEIETHIFFDDAFIRRYVNDNDPKVNEWVESLIKAVDKAASEVHEVRIRIKAPKKFATPYGGRLEWTLPGKTKMIAHLKDKAKIRAKKRWSQVMYMYYLLGHRIMERTDLSPRRKEVISENTFILALDGDIDFQPQAVHLLVDLMKKNKSLGAACGRIHPIGSGVMVWYQKFEYAIGHWLQKASEHMYGCVLCSPGCFSLFRAKTLMDDSVMKKYTMRAEQARHFVQYDQGEDRWLCTLILQRGYRVEYSAASDAFTHAPEGFNEFYNQRRRWLPSTMANIMDLIMDSKRTVEVNDNISKAYIFYQIVLMIGSILGPGTLFLMVVGALNTVFKIDQFTSLLWNLIPIVIYMIICYQCKSNIQLLIASIISSIYALVMMAVLVGIMLQISQDGWMAPTSLFLFLVAGEFIVSALLHPKEIGCLPYGIVYYITIPSMYMLLIIYSIFNLNNISWGTREVTVAIPANKEDVKEEENKKKEEVKVSTKNKIYSFFGKGDDNAGAFEFSLGGLMKIFLCSYRKESPEQTQLALIAENIKNMERKLDAIEKLVLLDPEEKQFQTASRSSVTTKRRITIMEGLKGELSKVVEDEEDRYSLVSESQLSDELLEPNSWMYQDNIGKGEFGCITTKEKEFWEGLIDKYLHPIDDDKEKIAKDLKDFRDKCVLSFLMINSLFVVVVFLLTLNKETVHIIWPIGAKYSFQYYDQSGDIELSKTYLELEPIGLVFVIFFGVLMGSQFIGMLMHRFSTYCQLLTSTPVTFDIFNKSKQLTDEELLEKDPVKVVKKLIKLRGAEDEDDKEEEFDVGRRKTVLGLAKVGAKSEETSITDLDQAFARRLTANARKSVVVNAIEKRRSTIAQLKRSSVLSNSKPRASHVNFGFEIQEQDI